LRWARKVILNVKTFADGHRPPDQVHPGHAVRRDMTNQPIFDGHNDTLLRLWRAGDIEGRGFLEGSPGHIDLARARAGGFMGGFFAVFVPSAKTQGLIGESSDGAVVDEPPLPGVGADEARRASDGDGGDPAAA
jgi:hypothetical protein